MQLETSFGQEGDEVPTVKKLANVTTQLEGKVETLTDDVNGLNSDIDELNKTVSNMEYLLVTGKLTFCYTSHFRVVT